MEQTAFHILLLCFVSSEVKVPRHALVSLKHGHQTHIHRVYNHYRSHAIYLPAGLCSTVVTVYLELEHCPPVVRVGNLC